MSNRSRKKNKRGGRKVESNDSPEILDSRETLDSPASLRGCCRMHACGSAVWSVVDRDRAGHGLSHALKDVTLTQQVIPTFIRSFEEVDQQCRLIIHDLYGA